MKKHILSLYFGYHDSCVTISDNNEILLHLEAERYFRKKHIHLTPKQMKELVSVALDYLKISIDSIDMLYLAKWNNEFRKGKVELRGKKFTPIYTRHHENHIGTTYPAEFDKSLIICADGGSEDGTTKFYLKKGSNIKLLGDYDNEPITGKFYGTITQMIVHPNMGRAHDTYPGKAMGLVACGEYNDKYMRLISEYSPEINKLHKKGVSGLRNIFGISGDYDKPWLDKDRVDLAFTAQLYWQKKFMEKIKSFAHLSDNVSLVGGCALNVLLNTEIEQSGLFKHTYVTPISGDNGQSLGAILYHRPDIKCEYPYLGRCFGEIDKFPETLIEDLLSHKIVSWYQGQSEIGARALGHRSFIGLADSLKMKKRLSIELKKREPYRPVAPIIAKEYLNKFFKTKHSSPFMTYSPKIRKITKERTPAIIHYDDTSRIQTVSKEDNPILHKTLLLIEKETGAPILMNSSFNVAGEPIVDTPDDALRNFKNSESEVLYINGKRYKK